MGRGSTYEFHSLCCHVNGLASMACIGDSRVKPRSLHRELKDAGEPDEDDMCVCDAGLLDASHDDFEFRL